MEHIEFEPLVAEPTITPPSRPTSSRLGAFFAAVAVAATLAFAVTVLAGIGRGAPPDRPVAQAATVLPAPEPDDETVAPRRPTRFESAYTACMSGIGGSPDAREHWVASCRREAEQTLHDDRVYAACMNSAGGSADSMERHAARCNEQVDSRRP